MNAVTTDNMSDDVLAFVDDGLARFAGLALLEPFKQAVEFAAVDAKNSGRLRFVAVLSAQDFQDVRLGNVVQAVASNRCADRFANLRLGIACRRVWLCLDEL